MEKKLAIFDSGIGGLSLLFYLKSIADIHVTYLADNSHFPYGPKTELELVKIVDENIQFLKLDHSDIIIACNTASMIFEKHLKNKYDYVYPIISHTIDTIKQYKDIKHIGIIGTKQTIESTVYPLALHSEGNYETSSLVCGNLVTYSEELNREEDIVDYIEHHFNIFKERKIDAIVLSCTHFNRLKTSIETYFDHRVKVIPSGYGLIEKLLEENQFENKENIVYLTRSDPKYLKKIIKFIKMNHNFEI